MKIKLLACLFVFSTLPSLAMAEDSVAFANCMDKSGGVTSAMIDCIDAELKHQDAQLNKAYKRLQAAISSERKKQLLAAQRAWIKFRDANCGFYFDPNGGSIARVNAADCMRTMTEKRAAELVKLYESENP